MPARRPLLASLALVSAGLLRARGGLAATATWDLVTEYPTGSMPGEGVAHFAAAATRLSAGMLAVHPGLDAPRNLRRHIGWMLLVDGADTMEATAEGNPIKLAEQRTLSFAGRKTIVGSTPLTENSHALRKDHPLLSGRALKAGGHGLDQASQELKPPATARVVARAPLCLTLPPREGAEP